MACLVLQSTRLLGCWLGFPGAVWASGALACDLELESQDKASGFISGERKRMLRDKHNVLFDENNKKLRGGGGVGGLCSARLGVK